MEIFDRVTASVSLKFMNLYAQDSNVLGRVSELTGVVASNTETGQWLFESDLETVLKINTILYNYAESMRSSKGGVGSEYQIAHDQNIVNEVFKSVFKNETDFFLSAKGKEEDADSKEDGNVQDKANDWLSKSYREITQNVENQLEESDSPKKRSRQTYPRDFKLKVIQHAEKTNNTRASRLFKIDTKCVRAWRKVKAALQKLPEDRHRLSKRVNLSTKPEERTEVDGIISCESDADEVDDDWNLAVMMEDSFGMKSNKPTIKSNYPLEFKLKVIEFAEDSSNTKASRQFHLDENCIKYWRLNKSSLMKLSSNCNTQCKSNRPCLSSKDVKCTLQEVDEDNNHPENVVFDSDDENIDYSNDFKQLVIKYAESTTDKGAAKMFNIDETFIRRWKLNQTVLSNVSEAHIKSPTTSLDCNYSENKNQKLLNELCESTRMKEDKRNSNDRASSDTESSVNTDNRVSAPVTSPIKDDQTYDNVQQEKKMKESLGILKSKQDTPGQRGKYSTEYKLKVIEYAENTSNVKAGNVFSIDESCIRRWRAKKSSLMKMPKSSLRITKSLKQYLRQKSHDSDDDNEREIRDDNISDVLKIDKQDNAVLSKEHGKHTDAFKLSVIEFAELNSNADAAKQFLVNERMVQTWQDQKESLKKSSTHVIESSLTTDNPDRCDVEEKLKEWLKELEHTGKKYSWSTVNLMAGQLSHMLGMTNFKGGSEWVHMFLEKNGFLNLCNTPLGCGKSQCSIQEGASAAFQANEQIYSAGEYEQTGEGSLECAQPLHQTDLTKDTTNKDAKYQHEEETDDEDRENDNSYDSEEDSLRKAVFDNLRCKECEFCARDYSDYKKHLTDSHDNCASFICPVCNKPFAMKNSLFQHLKTHRMHTCEICDRSFKCRKYLRQHMASHAKKFAPPAKIPCDICGQMLAGPLVVKNHIKVIHMGIHPEKKFQCEICGKKFLHKAHCVEHKNRHLGIRPFSCTKCDGKFKGKQELKTHIAYVHEDQRNHVCEICGKSFHNMSGLKAHVKIHMGQMDYQCDICSKLFTQKHSLDRHKYIHTGERPFQCELCGDTFNDSGILRRHVMGVHKMAYSLRKGIHALPDKNPKLKGSKKNGTRPGKLGKISRPSPLTDGLDMEESHKPGVGPGAEQNHLIPSGIPDEGEMYANAVHAMTDWAKANEAILRYNQNLQLP